MKNKMTVQEKETLCFGILGFLFICLAYVLLFMTIGMLPNNEIVFETLQVVMFFTMVGMVIAGVMVMKQDQK